MCMPPLRPFIATVLLLGAVAGSSPASAQQPAAPPPSADANLDRIRRTFAETAVESKFVGPVRADYRVRVEEETPDAGFDFGWIYDRTTATPGYVRPWYPISHFEVQQMLLPKEFRAHLYPIGVPTGDFISAVKKAFRDRSREKRERDARNQVEAEVKALRDRQP
jgi:hypothetical protein